MLCFLTAGLLEAAPATVEIKFSAPVDVKQLAGRVLINSNRRYVLGSVPKSLQGLRYTRHEHDNPATLSVTVASAGDLYLCSCNNTPASLKLKGNWAPVGQTTVKVDRSYKFVFYKRSVKKGASSRFPRTGSGVRS